MKQCWHHDLGHAVADHSLKNIMKWHKKCHEKELNTEELVLIFMQIAGRHYHYDHQFVELCNHLKAKIKSHKNKQLKAQMKKNQEDHNKANSESTANYIAEKNSSHMYSIHGHEF